MIFTSVKISGLKRPILQFVTKINIYCGSYLINFLPKNFDNSFANDTVLSENEGVTQYNSIRKAEIYWNCRDFLAVSIIGAIFLL